MSGLTPERRLDRNGRLVTRHVRQETSVPKKRAPVPSLPALGRPGAPAAGASTPVKLRPSQTEPREVSGSWGLTALRHSPEMRSLREGFSFSFKVSDAAAYDVASACAHDGDAALLLSIGVRSAGEARAFLQSQSLGGLLADRSELTDAALAKGIHYGDFLKDWPMMSGDRPVANRIGALKLATSPLRSVYGIKAVVNSVLAGEIDFEDIRAVGIGRLKEKHMIVHFAPLLVKARTEEAGFSVQAIRALAERVAAEKPTPFEVENLGRVAALVGADAAAALPSIVAASDAYRSMSLRDEKGRPDAAERLLYMSRFFAAAGWHEAAREFYAAGIPVETAIGVHLDGGGAEQAAAGPRDGVTESLAGGYL